jgi:hypothetical protein
MCACSRKERLESNTCYLELYESENIVIQWDDRIATEGEKNKCLLEGKKKHGDNQTKISYTSLEERWFFSKEFNYYL